MQKLEYPNSSINIQQTNTKIQSQNTIQLSHHKNKTNSLQKRYQSIHSKKQSNLSSNFNQSFQNYKLFTTPDLKHINLYSKNPQFKRYSVYSKLSPSHKNKIRKSNSKQKKTISSLNFLKSSYKMCCQNKTVRKIFNNYCKPLQKVLVKQKMMKQLQRLWCENDIPQTHIQYMRKIIEKMEKGRSKLIEKEIKNLRLQNSNILELVRNIKQRESYLKDIKQLLNIRNEKNLNRQKMMNVFKRYLEQLRQVNLQTIQYILRWSNQLVKLHQKYLRQSPIILFSYQNKNNYLLQIIQDHLFIYQSKIFNHSIFPDPFFLSYDLPPIKQDNQYFKIRASQITLLQITLSHN